MTTLMEPLLWDRNPIEVIEWDMYADRSMFVGARAKGIIVEKE